MQEEVIPFEVDGLGDQWRAVTHLDVTRTDIDTALGALRRVLGG